MRRDLMVMMEQRVRELVDETIPEPHTTTFSPDPPADWPFEKDADLWLTVNVGDERFVMRLVQHGVGEDIYELLARVRSVLQDWIVESKFGWGEQR
jgi:hypothetical protein